MRRSLVFGCLVFILCGVCTAQTVIVSGTISDPDGQSWNNGTWSAAIFSPNGTPFFGNTPVPTTTFGGSLSGAGALISSGQFFNTSTITPSGAMYTVTVCSQTSAPCNTFNTPVVSGAGLIASINANITAPRYPVSVTAHGYSDAEAIVTPLPGGSYFNVITSTLRVWNGSTWQSSSGGSPYDPTNVAITGGSIDNTSIGQTTQAPGSFSTLSTNSTMSIPCVVGLGSVIANTLVQYTAGAATCVEATAGSGSVVGIALTTIASGGTVQVGRAGVFPVGCVADNNWVAGDLLVTGTVTAGRCKDSGVTTSAQINIGTEIVGRASTACTAGSTCPITSIGFLHFGTSPSFISTATLGGSSLVVGCTNQTAVTVTGAAVNMACAMSGAGSQPAGIMPQCFVSAANTVVPQLCTAAIQTPASTLYNIRVLP
jgi:hypothetical protein